MEHKKRVIVWTSHRPEHTRNSLDSETVEILPAEPKSEAPSVKKRYGKWLHGYSTRLKLVILATVSAVLLGLLFGAMTLKLFVAVEGGQKTVEPATVATNAFTSEKSEHSLQLGSYVLQGGVFTKRKNADEWLEKFKKKNVPAILWERGGNYYLFAGVASGENEAAQLAKKLQKKKLDIYVKEWNVSLSVKNANDAEKKWLDDLEKLWTASIRNASDGQAVSKKEWDKLAATVPEESKQLKALAKQVKAHTEDFSGKNPDNGLALLKMFKDL